MECNNRVVEKLSSEMSHELHVKNRCYRWVQCSGGSPTGEQNISFYLKRAFEIQRSPFLFAKFKNYNYI